MSSVHSAAAGEPYLAVSLTLEPAIVADILIETPGDIPALLHRRTRRRSSAASKDGNLKDVSPGA
ncbi:hypothetical protein [Sphingopyxis panaciterrae]|uniref:hypothetical protein n=1 Tax=Sphingopyxis panaciterrae TaxID=363841 RepID=UPI003132A4E5